MPLYSISSFRSLVSIDVCTIVEMWMDDACSWSCDVQNTDDAAADAMTCKDIYATGIQVTVTCMMTMRCHWQHVRQSNCHSDYEIMTMAIYRVTDTCVNGRHCHLERWRPVCHKCCVSDSFVGAIVVVGEITSISILRHCLPSLLLCVIASLRFFSVSLPPTASSSFKNKLFLLN